jgi:hypothetical protein
MKGADASQQLDLLQVDEFDRSSPLTLLPSPIVYPDIPMPIDEHI